MYAAFLSPLLLGEEGRYWEERQVRLFRHGYCKESHARSFLPGSTAGIFYPVFFLYSIYSAVKGLSHVKYGGEWIGCCWITGIPDRGLV